MDILIMKYLIFQNRKKANQNIIKCKIWILDIGIKIIFLVLVWVQQVFWMATDLHGHVILVNIISMLMKFKKMGCKYGMRSNWLKKIIGKNWSVF